MATSDETYKERSIEQWTSDPCAAVRVDDEPGQRSYFEKLLGVRDEYAPWMAHELDYKGSNGLSVLDVGCGQGIDLAQYAMAGANATGIDLTPRHANLARSHLAALGLTAEVVDGDAESLPFSEETFDKVSSNGVLHHTPNIEASLSEIHRVLKPNGKATIIVYNRQSLHYWLDQVIYLGLWKRRLFHEKSMEGVLTSVEYSSTPGTRPLVRVYSRGQMRRLLTAAGFSNVSVAVRHFWPEDAWLTAGIEKLFPQFRQSPILEKIGRRAGWYLVARGTRIN